MLCSSHVSRFHVSRFFISKHFNGSKTTHYSRLRALDGVQPLVSEPDRADSAWGAGAENCAVDLGGLSPGGDRSGRRRFLSPVAPPFLCRPPYQPLLPPRLRMDSAPLPLS